jgi:hypothetical protein
VQKLAFYFGHLAMECSIQEAQKELQTLAFFMNESLLRTTRNIYVVVLQAGESHVYGRFYGQLECHYNQNYKKLETCMHSECTRQLETHEYSMIGR